MRWLSFILFALSIYWFVLFCSMTALHHLSIPAFGGVLSLYDKGIEDMDLLYKRSQNSTTNYMITSGANTM